jgi:oligopeptide transport system permease protein
MFRFILNRVLEFVPTLFIVIAATFFLIRLAPGSPFLTERAIPAESRAVMEAKYCLDRPMLEQFFVCYLGNLVQGDLGLSTKYQTRSVNELVADALPHSLVLGAFALVWSLLIGIPAGIIGAIRQNKFWDHAAMGGAMVGISLPTFVLGPLLVLVFALGVYWLPPAGWGTFSHVVLPGITLGTAYAAYIARLTRGGMLEVVRSDFIRTARAKGLRESVIVWRHMLKGGLLPVVTFLGPAIARIMVGSVVVEKIFATPGLGPYFVDAALNRDYFLVLGLVVLYASLLLVMNLLVDISYGFLDPRVRYD